MTDIELSDLDALGCSSAVLDERSLQSSTLTAKFPLNSFLQTIPWEQMEEVRVLKNGKVIIQGIVSSKNTSIESGSAVTTLVISDLYWNLENSLCLSSGWQTRFDINKLVEGGGGAPVQMKLKIGLVLDKILDIASKKFNFNYVVDISSSALMIPWTISTNTYQRLMNDVMHWHPNLCSYWEYPSGGYPVLHVTDAVSSSPVVIDAVNEKTISIDLSERKDLVPSCVAVMADSNLQSGRRVTYKSVVPKDADIGAPLALVYQAASNINYDNPEETPEKTEGGGWQLSFQKNVVTGKPYSKENSAKSFWKEAMPFLEECGDDANWTMGTMKRDAQEWSGEGKKPQNYDGDVHDYRHVDGLINTGDSGIKWCDVKVAQTISVPRNQVPYKYRDRFQSASGNVLINTFTVITRTISTSRHEYIVSSDYSEVPPDEEPPEPEDPATPAKQTPYKDICNYIYESTRSTPWEGSIVFIPDNPGSYVGRRLSIRNAQPEWSEINSLVQDVRTDLQTNVVTISVGPPKYLCIEDILDLMNFANDNSIVSNTIENAPGAPVSEGTSYTGTRPETPTVGPMLKAWDPPKPKEPEYHFKVRVVYDEEGGIKGYEVMSGMVNPVGRAPFWCGKNGAADPEPWNYLAGNIDSIYLNIVLKDKSVEKESADFSPTPFPDRDIPIRVGIYPVEDPGWPGRPDTQSRYSILIATMDGEGSIQQYRAGDFDLPVYFDSNIVYNISDVGHPK